MGESLEMFRELFRFLTQLKYKMLNMKVLGVPYRPNYAYFQVGSQIGRTPGHRTHHEEQLQGARVAADVRRDGYAHLW